MAVTIISQPDKFSPVKNPVAITVETDNRYITAPSACVCTIIFNDSAGDIYENESITIAWADNEITYTFKDAPSTEFELQTQQSESWNDFVERVALQIKNNPIVHGDYEITVIHSFDYLSTIFFLARENGESYDLIVTEDSTALTVAPDENGVDAVERDFFGLYLYLFIELTGSVNWFTKVAELELEVDDDNRATFQVQDILRSYLQTAPLPADIFGEDVFDIEDFPLRWYYYVGEKYGDPPVPVAPFKSVPEYIDFTEDDFFRCVPARITHRDYPNNTFSSDYYEAVAKKWLTNMPSGTKLNENAPFWLYIFIDAPYDGLDAVLEGVITYTNGTTTNFDAYEFTATGGSINALPFHYSYLQSRHELPFGHAVIKSISVVLKCNGDTISETITLAYDFNYYQYNRYLFFQNAHGMMETIWLNGQSIEEDEVKSLESEKVLAPDFLKTDSQKATFAHEKTVKITANTGAKSREYLQYLALELLKSEHVFEVVEGELYPVSILTKKLVTYADGQNRYNADLSWQRAWVE